MSAAIGPEERVTWRFMSGQRSAHTTLANYAGIPIVRSSLVPPNRIIIVSPGGGDVQTIVFSPWARDGRPSAMELLSHPVPGWSRYSAGANEAARDRRRRAR